MSLLESAMESFTKLKKVVTEDGYGGYTEEWSDDFSFKGALAFNSSVEAQVAEKDGVTGLYTLTTIRGIVLEFHDVVRREKNGKTYRVTTDGSFTQTPMSATLDMRQVKAERWDLPAQYDEGEEDG